MNKCRRITSQGQYEAYKQAAEEIERHLPGWDSAEDIKVSTRSPEGTQATAFVADVKAASRYKGRAPTAQAKADQVRAPHQDGIGPSEIARRAGIGRSSVHRILKAAAGRG